MNEIKNAISHICDGPVTDYVMIARAVRLAAEGKHDADTIAEALYELLGLDDADRTADSHAAYDPLGS